MNNNDSQFAILHGLWLGFCCTLLFIFGATMLEHCAAVGLAHVPFGSHTTQTVEPDFPEPVATPGYQVDLEKFSDWFHIENEVVTEDNRFENNELPLAPNVQTELLPQMVSMPVANQFCVRGIRPQDEIILVDVRPLECKCDTSCLERELKLEQLVACDQGKRCWNPTTSKSLLDWHRKDMPTVIFAHGNRISAKESRGYGLDMYRATVSHAQSPQPIRFVIWSWPSSQVSGPLNDFKIKSTRADFAGYQLAWLVNQMPSDLQVSMIGYSYGARVVCGSLHCLAGGKMRKMRLQFPQGVARVPIRSVLIAAATDSHWFTPNAYHGRALQLVDRMLVVTNHYDPAMKFYPLSRPSRELRAMGKRGPTRIGPNGHRVFCIDVTYQVGRYHELPKYMQITPLRQRIWQYVSFQNLDLDLASGTATPINQSQRR